MTPSRGPWLTASQAAARLGIKPATLYAYVSRGLIPRRRGPDGRTSQFAVADVERLAKRTPHSRLAPTDIVVPNAISLVDANNGALWYRGVDAIEATTKHHFEEIAEFLWTGRWNATQTWEPDGACLRAAERAQRALARTTPLVDRLGVIVAAARTADPQRGDTTPEGAVRTGRNLLATVVEALPPKGDAPTGSLATRLAARLTKDDITEPRRRILDHLLCVSAEHGVTLSVIAARLAAGYGADPYAAVGSALGPASAAIDASRFPTLESMLRDGDRAAAIERGHSIGVSIDPYPKGDPRARFILEELRNLNDERASIVDATACELRRRGKAEPDMTFATAAASFVLGFEPGSSALITAVARIAGWIAHAISEYRQPTPFRPHATYVGTMPAPEQRDQRELLHAVWDYLRDD